MTRDSYLTKIKQRLHLDRRTKQRVIEGIQTEIQLLLDEGATLEEAVDKLGSPKEIARDYNQSYKHDPEYQKKWRSYVIIRVAIIIIIAATVLLITSQVGKYIFFNSGHVSTTGGVSGPESVVETIHTISPLFFLDIAERIALILLVAFVLSIICWLLTRIKRK